MSKFQLLVEEQLWRQYEISVNVMPLLQSNEARRNYAIRYYKAQWSLMRFYRLV